MNATTAEAIRAVYIAISAALSDEGANLSRDILLAVANNSNMTSESRRLCRWIAETGRPTAEAEKLQAISASHSRRRCLMTRHMIPLEYGSNSPAGFIERHSSGCYLLYDKNQAPIGFFSEWDACIAYLFQQYYDPPSLLSS
jgi:hypothetical protein